MLAAAIAVAVAAWHPMPAFAVHVYQLPRGVLGQTACYPSIDERQWCELRIDARRWRWRVLCSVVVHEAGHAAGYRDPVGVHRSDGTVDLLHSPDPRNVMYPALVRTADACRGKRPARYSPGAVVDLRS